MTPLEYYGAMIDILKNRRSYDVDVQHLDGGQVCNAFFFFSFL